MKKLLTGNEAIAEGAIAAGVEVVAGYPGTPSTEVILNLMAKRKELDFHIEWSVNEKVAFEICRGCCLGRKESFGYYENVWIECSPDL